MKTKFLKYTMLFAGVLTLFSSCKKYLDVTSPSTTAPEVAFESTTYTNSVLIGIYSRLCGDYGYGIRVSLYFPQTADDFRTSGDYSSTDRRGISMYGASPDNADLSNTFLNFYTGIERANIAIKYIPASKLYSNGTASEKTLLQTYYGEALALRAQFYYELIRNWGDVPAPFIPAADQTELAQPNANRDATYDQILADLKTAEGLVPWRSENPSYGDFRFTKGAIKGLRARVALARGGYSLRTETHKMERRADYMTYYKIAYDECLDLIGRRGEHSLNPVYENIFKSLHTTTRYDDAHELMFEVASYGANASTDSKLGYYDGLNYSNSPSYGTAGGGVNAIPTYFYEFDQIGDCRRDVTIGSYMVNNLDQKILVIPTSQTDAKFRKSWTGISGTTTAQNFSINWPILRFADVLLMYAEADNEINGSPSAKAIDALNEIKARAYVGFTSRIPNTPTDHDGFFNAIVKERLLEFGGEGVRKFDLIRWNLINSKFTETRTKLTQFMNGEGPYQNLPAVVFVNGVAFKNGTSTAEVAGMDLYGGAPNTVLFQPNITTTRPSAYSTSVNWRSAVSVDNITGNAKGFATYFEANKKELFPYPTTALVQNINLKQNYGY
ncbi:RagB/SusD family nutrient uptake outer membrane protein [Pedobacter sp. HMWF019]|uniref:RagB/SusD family nutrient uptake outer membrane protein n=1 Tax=Pedobacter sp. HMWF019 TaxID=2056856 RepID=UPI000D37EFB8|nr:RagB/SusD family nutrient uptake outer membrane protein [Pedobacter sp. HMWF019]PTT01706.1 RagB/SusD family nutrient uptake outer membrane protein [Pedobacter sp. HMWF019]